MGWNKTNSEAMWPVVAVRLPMAEREALKRLAKYWDKSQSYVIRYGITLAAREMGISTSTSNHPSPRLIDDIGDQMQLILDYEADLATFDGKLTNPVTPPIWSYHVITSEYHSKRRKRARNSSA